MMRHTMTGIAVASLTVLAVGCGGSDGGPKDASKEDFCDSYTEIIDIAGDGEMKGKEFKEWAADLEKVGTPEDISEDQREGYEVFVKEAKDIDDDDNMKAGDEPIKVSEDDKKKVEDFDSYAAKKCDAEMKKKVEEKVGESMPSGLPSDTPSDMPSEIPSELESQMSDLPTEIPSDLESKLSDLPTEMPSS